MAKWCEVKCNCPERRPIDPSSKYGDYVCGHCDGILIGISPNGFRDLAYALAVSLPDAGKTFAVFAKIYFPQTFDNDTRFWLSADERDLWRLEIKQVQEYLSGQSYMGWQAERNWNAYWKKYSDGGWDKVSGTPSQILQDAIVVCDASEQTKNPIEFIY